MFLAIFIPPLYFILNKRVWMFLITSAMFVLAFCLALTFVLLPGSLILWLIATIMAVVDYKRKAQISAMTTHAELVATKMADKFPGAANPNIPPQNRV